MIELPDRIIQLGIAKTDAFVAYTERKAQSNSAFNAYRDAVEEYLRLQRSSMLFVTSEDQRHTERIVDLAHDSSKTLIAYVEHMIRWSNAGNAYRTALLEYYGLKPNDMLPVTDQFQDYSSRAADNARKHGFRYPKDWSQSSVAYFRFMNEDGHCTCDIVGQPYSLSVHVPLEVIDEMVQLRKKQL